MNVRLRIDRLVLDGLPLEPGEGARVKETVEAELTRLLRERAPALGPGGAGIREDVLGGEIVPEAGDTPEVIGRKIARAIHGGIRP